MLFLTHKKIKYLIPKWDKNDSQSFQHSHSFYYLRSLPSLSCPNLIFPVQTSISNILLSMFNFFLRPIPWHYPQVLPLLPATHLAWLSNWVFLGAPFQLLFPSQWHPALGPHWVGPAFPCPFLWSSTQSTLPGTKLILKKIFFFMRSLIRNWKIKYNKIFLSSGAKV